MRVRGRAFVLYVPVLEAPGAALELRTSTSGSCKVLGGDF